MIGIYSEGDSPVPGFQLLSRLGGGEHSEVWKASAPGGTEAALKIVNLSNNQTIKEVRSLRLLKHLRHPHIVPVMGFWFRDRRGRILDENELGDLTALPKKATELVIAMGLGDMSLADRLHECQADGLAGMPVDELLQVLRDAARGIDYLNQPIHNLGTGRVAFQHCDIKPENILMVAGAGQVCDLGVIRVLGDLRTTRAVGSAAYMAPEVIQNNAPSSATDQYALAITYYELRTGQLAFDAQSPAGAYFAHLKGQLDFSLVTELEAIILTRATAGSPSDRFPSCSALISELHIACSMAELADVTEEAHAVGTGMVATVVAPPGKRQKRGLLSTVNQARRTTPFGISNAGSRPPGMIAAELAQEAHPFQLETEEVSPEGDKPVQLSHRRRFMPWLILAVTLGGMFGAWLNRGSEGAENPQPLEAPSLTPLARPFVLESSGTGCANLAEAVATAYNCDTITIHSSALFLTEPLEIRDKSLTIKAAPGFRPIFHWCSHSSSKSWQSLLSTNSALTLEGLELHRQGGEAAAAPAGPASLLETEGPALHLRACHLSVPRGSGAIVCRRPESIQVDNCTLIAYAVALWVDAGATSHCRVHLGATSIQVEDSGAAALAFSSNGQNHPQAVVRLHLQDNSIRAGRIAAIKSLAQGIQIQAENNRFTFRDAVLSFAGYPNLASWRDNCSWQGENNDFFGKSEWLQIEGRSAGIHNPQQWHSIWLTPKSIITTRATN